MADKSDAKHPAIQVVIVPIVLNTGAYWTCKIGCQFPKLCSWAFDVDKLVGVETALTGPCKESLHAVADVILFADWDQLAAKDATKLLMLFGQTPVELLKHKIASKPLVLERLPYLGMQLVAERAQECAVRTCPCHYA